MTTHPTTAPPADAAVDLRVQAEALRALHTRYAPLLLPNVWDAASAKVVSAAGFPAVATSSAAVAAMLGLEDGQRAPWQDMFAAAARVASAVAVPVSVDAEGGYGLTGEALVQALLELGAVGCNLEDTDHEAGGLKAAEAHAAWLATVRAAADRAGVPIVINARIDTFLPQAALQGQERIVETLRRGQLYLDAGADCLYPIGVRGLDDLTALVAGLDGPVNGNVSEELTLPVLRELGVARVSFGPSFYRAGLTSFDAAARALRDQ
ncbi:MAG TPA: isocitrate lyase/phosphoenolpyruvate mutase family protein [Propionicimonas sp.]|jgi:2-methylisocitrate lyase-like PEP mutase family enzyme